MRPATSPETVESSPATGPVPGWRRLARSFADRALLDRIRDGRIRDVDWPERLGAVVAIGAAVIGLSCLLALASGWLRTHGELLVPNTLNASLPDGTHWVLVSLVLITVALGQTAVLHAPWWLTTVGTMVTAVVVGLYGLSGAGSVTGLIGPAVSAGVIVALIVFTAVRHRRRFAWWEFPVVLALTGAAALAGLAVLTARSRFVGAEFVPELTRGNVQILLMLALPAAVAAGTAVAELTVAVTTAAAVQLERVPGRRWPYVLLGAAALVLAVELGWRIGHLDPVWQGWLVVLPALVLIGLSVVVIGGLLRVGRRSGSAPVLASELPEELGGIALPLGAVVVGLAVPLLLIGSAYAIVLTFDPAGAVTDAADPITPISELAVPLRLVLGAVLIVLAVRLVRRGRQARAILFGAIALTLAATGMRTLVGTRSWAIRYDPDTVGLIAAAGVLLLVLGFAVARRLTPQRALAGTVLVLLCLVFSLRQYLGDPVGTLIGYSGVGLVVFGLLWDLLTGSGWANGESRRFPRPTRVLLVLTNSALLAVVVAYTTLIRDPSLSVDDFVELGDLVLGVGLLAATFAVVLQAFLRDRPLR